MILKEKKNQQTHKQQQQQQGREWWSNNCTFNKKKNTNFQVPNKQGHISQTVFVKNKSQKKNVFSMCDNVSFVFLSRCSRKKL